MEINIFNKLQISYQRTMKSINVTFFLETDNN